MVESNEVENQRLLDVSEASGSSSVLGGDTRNSSKSSLSAVYTFNLIIGVLVSCLSSVQYGYHMSELNAPEAVYTCQKSVPLGEYKDSWFGKRGIPQCITLSNSEIGIVTSIFSIGGLLGSIYAGKLADKFGRKRLFIVNSFFFIIGSMVETFSKNYYQLLIGRLISGIGAGSGIVVTPLYINEISPLELRGTLGSMNQVSINVGILLTQLLAISWSNDEQWRFILLFGSALGTLNLFGAFLIIDESPKWLTINGFKEKDLATLMKLRNSDLTRCQLEIEDWKQQQLQQATVGNELSFIKYFTLPQYSEPRKVVDVVMVGQQFCGINSIIFYGVKVLVSLFPNSSIMINCFISVINAVVTFGASLFIDKLGRKPMLLSSVSVMCLASIGIGSGILLNLSSLTVLSTFLYVGSFAIGLGPIPFLIIPEVTQNEAKGIAQSYGTTLNWLATFAVGYLFPILNEAIGGLVYFIFASVCVAFFTFTYYKIPETKNKNGFEQVWR
ncbi:hypothetical protein PACTADRAFT_36752 [Pachysolen tannophilus NRRL Y-2460]|uniref:Major facilitator superfamily (MFS) profile domain-containing protein n=1 Tax=Pachysolen tannophilus NRRL Y-2460 TaxID=669874 RepID=A0A1E4U3H5_PACTA|nr:hypothetical protein PACTADRAFT_36752 [Pachysolen tannophilus NRRL Y-2460]